MNNISIHPTCCDESQPCEACGTTILDHNWRLVISIDNVDYVVHDNEGVCRDKLLYSKGIIEPTFLASRPIS